jgi:glutamate--cysteine ligase
VQAVLQRLDEAILLADLRDRAFAPSSGPVHVGLELEMLALRGNRAVPIVDLLDAMEPLFALGELGDVTPPSGLTTYAYGPIRLTFEPGGQMEIVTPPRPSIDQALEDIQRLELLLQRVLPWRGIRLASYGLNPWQKETEIELQTPLPRYRAMERYFSHTGPGGLRMMRLSCALQINVDIGAGTEAEERWRLANLMAPVLTGMFANSPAMGGEKSEWRSARSLVWHDVDPSRTGSLLGPDGPQAYLDFALDAGLLLRRAPDGYRPGHPGYAFGDWLRDGDDLGYPTLDDWQYHLTTLFPQVRPRGSFELRSIDSPPAEWRCVPVAVATALLVDGTARERGIACLEPYAGELGELAALSAHHGPAHPLVGALACELLGFALESFDRLPRGFVSSAVISDVRRFVDRYTARGRCPADDPIDLDPPAVFPPVTGAA